MGLTISCPSGETNLMDESFDALLGSINFGGNYGLCNGNLNTCDPESNLMRPFGSGKYIIEGSVNFERKETNPFRLETKFSFKRSNGDSEISVKSNDAVRARFSDETVDPGSPKHDAAVKLQKFYKSFRTRRQLADCAVLIEQKWWKLLDFALLKRSSVSFFDIDKPESAVSKWSRARTRAAKVGKGLSKNSKARKLALQHWLEAIDPRHRYGHNLHFYYACWLRCESKQPFFYWLDVGEGKEVNLETCSRTKLQQQCIKYLGPKEREAYEVIVEEGRFIYKKSRKILDTTGGLKDSKWIFVLSASKNLYVGLKRKGQFQHSSFLAGGATSAAGRLVVENGFLKAVWPHSGHYRPTEENFEDFMSFLDENNVALADVKKIPVENDGEWVGSCISRSDSSMPNSYSDSPMDSELQLPNSGHESDSEAEVLKDLNSACEKDDQTSEGEEEKESESTTEENQTFETVESSCSFNTEPQSYFMEDKEDDGKETLPEELIIERISSKKLIKPCHMGTKLNFNWTTGAGARIGYVRNYPSELQFQALEQVNLSPRAVKMSRPFSSSQNTATCHWQKIQGSTLKESTLQR